MFKIGKFLKISKALYDGSDESRWMSLPSRKPKLRYQLMDGPSWSREFDSRSREISSRRGSDCLGW